MVAAVAALGYRPSSICACWMCRVEWFVFFWSGFRVGYIWFGVCVFCVRTRMEKRTKREEWVERAVFLVGWLRFFFFCVGKCSVLENGCGGRRRIH